MYERKDEFMNSFGDAWELICSYCKTKITDVAYNTWIVRIKPMELDFDSNTAYLIVPNDFHRQTITRCYIPLLNEAFEAIFDNKFQIALKIPEEVEQTVAAPKKIEEEKIRQRVIDNLNALKEAWDGRSGKNSKSPN